MTATPRPCCAAAGPPPTGDERAGPQREVGTPRARTPAPTDGMVEIDAGRFLMGNTRALSYPADGEGPVREVSTAGYWIDTRAVSNAEFGRFVDATGYRTDAERSGWSFVFGGLLPDDFPTTRGVAAAPWWREVHGADWRHPDGPQSDIHSRQNHPVVHVTWYDASAYCAWSGKRLPVEAEWERAARGGLPGKLFPWGDELEPQGRHWMNVWQGRFPQHNTGEDGWYATCPVDAFEPNGFGLYNMTGNVWEWCADWFTTTHQLTDGRADPGVPASATHRITKGGSYLCHASYCHRYRVAARSQMTPDSMCGNLGFRCVTSNSA